MRPIKFRVWDTVSKLWVADWKLTQSGVESNEKGYVWMQFTGLHDKNGKEIYEGDVLHYGFYGRLSDTSEEPEEDLERPMNFPVRWSDVDGSFIANGRLTTRSNTGEIIGNIYENPELIPTPTPS